MAMKDYLSERMLKITDNCSFKSTLKNAALCMDTVEENREVYQNIPTQKGKVRV